MVVRPDTPALDPETAELLWRYHHDSRLRRLERESEHLDYPEGLSAEHNREAQFWEAVQDHLIRPLPAKQYHRGGMPTSNLHIADLKGYHELPDFPLATPSSGVIHYAIRNG